jgi:two-component system sensor histidine kinase BaeS
VRVGLRTKLFFALLATLVLAVAATSIAARVTFVSGFLGYLNEQESDRVEHMIPRLALMYGRYGSWDFLYADPRLWLWVLMGFPEADADSFFPDDEPFPPFPRMPESDLTGLNLRIALFDQRRDFVSGNPAVPPDASARPIIVKGVIVGYLAVLPFQRAAAVAATRLQNQQIISMRIIGAGGIFLAAVVSISLTRRVLAPVRRIAAATHLLAAGNYGTRLHITSADEIGQLADDFNRLALALQRNEQMRRVFVADVSHELRTPLAILCGELDAIEDNVRPLTPESLTSLQSEVATLSKLVNDLFDLSLADLGALTYRMSDVDIAGLLRMRVHSFTDRLAERRIVLESHIADEALIVTADQTRIHQLINNLMENSLRYTHPEGRARVSCYRDRQQVMLIVEDSEPGVPPEIVPRLFERFYRMEGSRNRVSGGAGLGLAISKSIAEAHGGTIFARASSLGGLCVSVSLPLRSTEL